MLLDEVRAVVNKEHEISETIAMTKLDLVFEQWLARNWNHRLGQIAEPITQPRPGAACKDYGLAAHG